MKCLELKIPPLLLVVIFAAIMYGASRLFPPSGFDPFLKQIFFLTMSLVSGAIVIAGAWRFRVAKTTVNPINPEASTALVQTGIYRYTRNPMYLGFACFLVGFGVWLDSPISILMVPVFIAYLTVYQIKPEEEALARTFGKDFNQYKLKTRRWF